MRRTKEAGGQLTEDVERYLDLHARYTHPVDAPFDQSMGGITARTFWNTPARFRDANNLSMVVFFRYGPFKILFPGDLEEEGWLALLEGEDFRAELQGTTVLVASHHGRESGYCDRVFDYCHPQAIVISDKAIVHDTQRTTQTYRRRVIEGWANGVFVRTTERRRHVLTTRRDGWIRFVVTDVGSFDIYTGRNG